MNDSHLSARATVALKRLSVAFHSALALVAFLLGSAAISCGQSKTDILSRLDQAAHSFTSATANIRVTNHTAIIDEDDTQIGTVTVKRLSPTEMHFLITFTGLTRSRSPSEVGR